MRFFIAARKFSQGRVLAQNCLDKSDLKQSEDEGEVLRNEIYLLSNALKSNSPVYELADSKHIVTKKPDYGSSFIKLEKDAIPNLLYVRKQRLYVMYMLGLTSYIENYDEVRKKREIQNEHIKTVNMVAVTVDNIYGAKNFSEAVNLIEQVVGNIDVSTKIKILSKLQEIAYKQLGQRVPDLMDADVDRRRSSITARAVFSQIKDMRNFVLFMQSIDPKSLQKSELLRYLHASCLLYVLDEKTVQTFLEKHIMATHCSFSLKEIDMVFDLLAWSSATEDNLKDSVSEDFLFDQFKRIICDEDTQSTELHLVLKLCNRFARQIGMSERTGSFRESLLKKLSGILATADAYEALHVLLWLQSMETISDTENVDFSDLISFTQSLVQRSCRLLAKSMKPQDFYYFPKIVKYFGSTELKDLRSRAASLIENESMSVRDIMLCGRVCEPNSLSQKTLDRVSGIISSCGREIFSQILCYLLDGVWRNIQFQKSVCRFLVSSAPFMIQNEIGLFAVYNYLSAICETKDTFIWPPRQIQEILSVYKEVVKDVRVRQSMHLAYKCSLFKLLLLIDKFTNIDIRSKVKIKDLAHSIMADGGADIEVELFLQLYKMFSKAGEITDRPFRTWVIRTCVGLLVNSPDPKKQKTLGTDPQYLRLLHSGDKMVVNLFVNYFYNKLWLEGIETKDENVMKSSVRQLLAVLDQLQHTLDTELLSKLLNSIPFNVLDMDDMRMYRNILENKVIESFKHLQVNTEHPDAEDFAEQYCKALQLLSRSIHAGCQTDALVSSVMSDDHMMMVFHIAAGNTGLYCNLN